MQIFESIISLLFTCLFTGAAEFPYRAESGVFLSLASVCFGKTIGVNFNSLTLATFKITLIEIEHVKCSRTSLLSKTLVKHIFC